MNNGDNFSLESKCRFLQQQLLILGYEHNTFSVDSLPLLESLVTDLLQTTDTLKHYKELSQGCLQACHDLETFVDAYKKDNAWLLGELNSLHLSSVSEKIVFEKRIADLENNLKTRNSEPDSAEAAKSRTRYCQKSGRAKSDINTHGDREPKVCKNLKEKSVQYEDVIKNKDNEIQHLYSEIFRLNNLLSEGRPIDSIFKDVSHNYNNGLYQIHQNNVQLQQHLNEAMLSQHEAKFNALKLAEIHQGSENKKSEVNYETLKQIGEELDNLKCKCQKLELASKNSTKKNVNDISRSQHEQEISLLKNAYKNLENEKSKLEKDLQELKTAYENVECANSKFEKDLSELKCQYQELLADKSEKEKRLKKYLDDKKYLTNRIQELVIIEKDLTSEITRLCDINAVHKRHILELENRLLESCQSKLAENLIAKLDLQVTKKPLEKRTVKPSSTYASRKDVIKNKENKGNAGDGSATEMRSLSILSQIREKYNKQIEAVREQSLRNVEENVESVTTPDLQPRLVSIVEEVAILRGKVNNLKNNLSEKEQLLSNLQKKNKELQDSLNDTNAQKVAQQEQSHDCEHCRLAEKRIAVYKEKLVKLEVEKNESIMRQIDYQRTLDCQNQHIMQLRTELHETQMELQQSRLETSKISTLEEQTNLTVASSKVLQKQLEVQLESAKKQLHLMRKETANVKAQAHSLEEENLKLRREIMDHESHKDKLLILIDEKCQQICSLEKLIKDREAKILNVEQTLSDFQIQLQHSETKTDCRTPDVNVDQMKQQMKTLERTKDQAVAENSQLKKDLNSLTQKYLSCKNELEKIRNEAQDLKVQVHDYIAKVQAAEETLQQKDKERSEMLEHFRTLTVETRQLGNNNLTLESETRSTKNLLRSAESKIIDLEHVIQNKDALISSYLEQIDILTKNVARLETQISNLTDQRDRLQAELDSCELLGSRIDKLEDTLPTIKFTGRKLEEELYRLQSENERLQKHVPKERLHFSTSECILLETKSDAEQIATSAELRDEIRGLKANIKCLKEALESTSYQLRLTQKEASEYKEQMIRLKNELKNLQFDNIRNCDHSISYSTL